MVRLAELGPEDVTLDPACGTARFHAMENMIKRIKSKNSKEQATKIKTEKLFGSDYDANVAKLAKMNMYIRGDGKSNILDRDGLLLYDLDNKVDVILTNPPLGDQSHQKTDYDNHFIKDL